MFLKPFKLKNNSPLKGSDVKKLRQRIEKAFPNTSMEQHHLIMPPKANVSMLKLTTHSDLSKHVYCVDKLPMFFEIDDGLLVPSLYALWKVPTLLPYFTTFGAVLPHLTNGADLMLPGVIPQGIGMNIYGRYKKGQLVAINLTTNRSAVGVGILPRSSDDMYMCGGRGSAVKMLHLFGDKLWGHEPTLAQQVPEQKTDKLTDEDFPALGDNGQLKKKREVTSNEQSLPINIGVSQISLTSQPIDTLAEAEKYSDDIRIMPGETQIETVEYTDAPDSKSQTEDILAIALRTAFLAALKNHGKSLQLPLLTSNFYRVYVVPEATEAIELKKTRYKKLSNFLNEMVESGFIVVREETKGVDKIVSINFDHPELVNFIMDYKKPAIALDAEGTPQPLFRSELTELYIVTDATAAFFTKMNYKRGEGIPQPQIKKIIREYISKENLTVSNPASKAVSLDDTLQQVCDGCSEAPLNKIVNVITGKMEHSFQMCSVKSDIFANKPLIQMSLATRSGNKKVTLISNVDCYGIIIPEFIKLCKQGAAASTTIIKLPNQKREQLQVQGNQVRFLFNLLTETYKVPAKYILGLELAKDGKKNKKK